MDNLSLTAAANKVRREKDELIQPELTEPEENNGLSLQEPEFKTGSVLETEQRQERQFNIHIPDSEPAKSEVIEVEAAPMYLITILSLCSSGLNSWMRPLKS